MKREIELYFKTQIDQSKEDLIEKLVKLKKDNEENTKKKEATEENTKEKKDLEEIIEENLKKQ